MTDNLVKGIPPNIKYVNILIRDMSILAHTYRSPPLSLACLCLYLKSRMQRYAVSYECSHPLIFFVNSLFLCYSWFSFSSQI